MWVDAELIGEHWHVNTYMGWQYGQDEMPTYEKTRDFRNDTYEAGSLILHKHEWMPYIQALAVGGYTTGLRVCWSDHTIDRRDLWNGSSDGPCLLGDSTPVEWVRESDHYKLMRQIETKFKERS